MEIKNTRKVTFIIDVLAWMQKYYNLTDEQIKKEPPFEAVYTLYGIEDYVDRYTLTDFSGNKLDIDRLNAFERGTILGDCFEYFVYRKNQEELFGVVDIRESKI